MKKWKYMIRHFIANRAEDKFKQYGESGWELIQIVGDLMIFKRELTNNND